MRLIVEENRAAAENMAMDEVLLRAFGGEPVWRVYTWDGPAVTFGRTRPYPGTASGFPVIRRLTGGGIVPHGADLTYAVVQERRRGYENYENIIVVLAGALRAMGIDCDIWERKETGAGGPCFASLAPFDIHVEGRKLAGCAQYRARDHVLHHGSIANGKPPPDVRDLRFWDQRSAVTIEEILGRRLSPGELAEAVRAVLSSSGTGVRSDGFTTAEEEAAGRLADKYRSETWNKEALWGSELKRVL